MKSRFRLYRRAKTGMFYLHDGDTGKQESLGTRDRAEAKTFLGVRNEARIEVSSELTLLLPFDHFLFSELRQIDEGQRLRALFVSHEVALYS